MAEATWLPVPGKVVLIVCLRFSEWALGDNIHYCHITPNETANGVQFRSDPDCGDIPWSRI